MHTNKQATNDTEQKHEKFAVCFQICEHQHICRWLQMQRAVALSSLTQLLGGFAFTLQTLLEPALLNLAGLAAQQRFFSEQLCCQSQAVYTPASFPIGGRLPSCWSSHSWCRHSCPRFVANHYCQKVCAQRRRAAVVNKRQSPHSVPSAASYASNSSTCSITSPAARVQDATATRLHTDISGGFPRHFPKQRQVPDNQPPAAVAAPCAP